MSSKIPPRAAAKTTERVKTVALIGNPNTGKTTLFNALTGLSQRVGNFPGVTVERKMGRLHLEDAGRVEVLDLPGTYSLAARSPDEMIVVDVLLGQQEGTPTVDAVVVIVDASNLRRNLYLVSQLLETGLPLVVALNMMDVAAARGIRIGADSLVGRLGVPVVPTCAHRRQGLDELRRAIAAVVTGDRRPSPLSRPQFPATLQRQAAALRDRSLPSTNGHASRLSSLEAFRALVDENGYMEKRLVAVLGGSFAAELARRRAAAGNSSPLSALESTARYAWIDQAVAECVRQPDRLRTSRSDRVDRVLTHRIIGLLAFFAINALIFQALYAWAGPLMDAVEALFSALGNWVGATLPEGALQSLLVDGIIAGVGGVLVFLPQIAILFFFISVLEDCGYMARAALLMDRLLTGCGLSGKSFIPLLSSFACAVPGIMATRTIEDRRDRFTTILVAPLMSCSARLPVYVLFIGAFIPNRPLLGGWLNLQAFTLLAMYSIGVLVAIPVAWLLKSTLLKGEAPPFLLELPSYKFPVPRTVLLRVYQNSRAFVARAGGIILATTVVMWALAYFPRPAAVLERYDEDRAQIGATLTGGGRPAALTTIDSREGVALLDQSYLGRAGRLIEPAVRPLGWDWRIGMATLASFPAREVVISALGTIYSLGSDQDETSADLRATMRRATRADGAPVFTVPVARSVMVFFALCAQCMSTLVTIQRETRSWRWPAFAFGYMTLLAYAGAFLTFQVTTSMGWGG